MLPSLDDQLISELRDLDLRQNLRSISPLSGSSRTRVCPIGDARPLLSFSSNDYLGLSSDPRLIAAASTSFSVSGFGAGASRLISGSLPDHANLEEELATFTGFPATLLFPSGYQANLGAITALAGPGDLIVFDRLVHASLIDAFRLSRAKLAIFRHLDLDQADRHLSRLGPHYRRRFLVTESLFSMDGDVAPLAGLANLAVQHGAVFVVDEAHAFAALGPNGRGLCAHFGVIPDVFIATLGKALGTSGAFVAGSLALRDTLINLARPFIYTTAAPPPVVAAARAALRIASSPEGDKLRSSLRHRAQQLRSSLGVPSGDASLQTPILPVVLGESRDALEASHALRSAGIFVQAIRPPTVAPDQARLRITISARHTDGDIATLAAALRRVLPDTPEPGPCSSASLSSAELPDLPISALSNAGVVVLGTDTNVGKTTVACALLHLLLRRGRKPVPFKPVETGVAVQPTDAIALRAAANRHDLPLETICPYSAADPVAPAIAFPSANGPRPEDLIARAAAANRHGDFLLVETAGGLLSPYLPDFTSLDLASCLGLPVLLVARNALGTVNHTALAVAEIRRRALPLAAVILTSTTASSTPDRGTNAALIARQTGVAPLAVLPFLAPPDPVQLAAALEASPGLASLFAALAI